MTRNKA